MIERVNGPQGYPRAVRVEAFVKGWGRLLFGISPRNSVLKRITTRDGMVVVVVVIVERDKPAYR